jgi:hypothetical protein
MTDVPSQLNTQNSSENKLIIKKIKELKVDALYGKKKHYNAADRKQSYHMLIGIPLTIINIFLGSYIFAIITQRWPDGSNWLVGVLALIAAILAAFQTFFNFERQVEQHRSIATRYLAVTKGCSRLIAYYLDGQIVASELKHEFEEYSRNYDQITSDSERCPTNEDDYNSARQGFNDGEEDYTKSELNSE